ncbi:aminotransferase class I/II-fold pyridoxal phosphate-dependent enzyme [Rhodobacteraceae bacterium RKSG542]|uniref:aminotransferase class I/II-fold pyridoxal phosphate-dependent enzyme n=1 Tax=Pseudovibrio flavus TaxID=2529854 RepID=UPI0012BC936E|nr:aminotransferase class I/II-fold pyridoxal phosphate-dependent enzyme [Pseudovibrio flavus]MTI16949.1 aminotransferase class I/II-fold pyridoxal phosphate-dependent enzyme [Pseudovibrio flavus]
MIQRKEPSSHEHLLEAALNARKAVSQRKKIQRSPFQGSFDFSTLPEVKQLVVQKAAADFLGVQNPFFRPHQALSRDECQIDGHKYTNFASYNYLGFNGDARVARAAITAIEQFGTTVSASRIVAGERPFHQELERAIARKYGAEDAVVMVSGHATNTTTIGHLMGPDDLIITDSLVHNSISEGARLSGAARFNFPHNELDKLDRLLAENRHKYKNVLIVVEGLYSMDGDTPDLNRLVDLKSAYNAWLMVDEAHSLGVLGTYGSGLAEHASASPKSVEIWMGTLSKTLASCGGYIAGSKVLCDYLRATAPGFVYSVGLAPPLAASALKCLELMDLEPNRVDVLRANSKRFIESAKSAGLDTGLSEGYAVVPIMVGDSISAVALSNKLLSCGINALPIIFPAVPEKQARLRFFVTAAHSFEQIDYAVKMTRQMLDEVRSEASLSDKLRESISS